MRRLVLIVLAILIVSALGFWIAAPVFARVKAPIRVGLLHSLTGPMAISEKSMIDAEMLAIEELNKSGGLLGRRIEAIKADGRSDPRSFASEAERLISVEKVSVIVGCWSSACRKSVRPIVEKANHLLIYPVAYEGMEQSPQIIYTGAAANQQVVPTVKWCRDTLKAKTFYLIGTDTVWPRAVNAIIKDQLKAIGATLVGEEYIGLTPSAAGLVAAKAVKAAPDVILSTLEGDANLPFYQAIRAGDAAKIPVVTFSMTEDEFRELPIQRMTNDYAVCNYFQSIDRPENHEFVRRFKEKYGHDRVTCDAIATSYTSIKLWAQAVTEAETDQIVEVRPALLRQSRNAPEGVITIDHNTQCTWRPFFIGRVRPDGQVEIIESLPKPIRPVPYPFSRTSDEWEAFLHALSARWDGQWESPTLRKSGS